MENFDLFNIPDAETCVCKIIDYCRRHSTLRVQINHPNYNGLYNSLLPYVSFQGVYYFDAPIFWKGAGFELDTIENSAKLWRRVHPEQSSERLNQMAQTYRGYAVKTSEMVVKILAISHSVSFNVPDNSCAGLGNSE